MRKLILVSWLILLFSPAISQEYIVKITNEKNGKVYRLEKGDLVKVDLYRTDQVYRLKKARITDITSTSITFTPINRRFYPWAANLNELFFIGFKTPGSIISGIFLFLVEIIDLLTIDSAFCCSDLYKYVDFYDPQWTKQIVYNFTME